ncbi:MAG: nuclear transport factor 2 family protein [Sphingomonadaceae bacterium]|nr:nuclear transport factor 2 family protein [Sphingomonadaceae bacterium]
MSASNVAVIQGIYDAFAVGDVSGVLGAMSLDIVWNEADDFPYADGNPYVGPEAIAKGVLMRCGTEWDGFGVVVGELLDAGDTVVALGHYVGIYKATGKPMRAQLVHVWRIAGGKAVRFQQYANTLHVAHVTGLDLSEPGH